MKEWLSGSGQRAELSSWTAAITDRTRERKFEREDLARAEQEIFQHQPFYLDVPWSKVKRAGRKGSRHGR